MLPASSFMSLAKPRTCVLKSGYLAYTTIIFRLTLEVINASNISFSLSLIQRDVYYRYYSCYFQDIFEFRYIINSMYYEVLISSQKYHGDKALSYRHDEDLEIGTLVTVPLGKNVALGIVCQRVKKPNFIVKNIIQSWNNTIIPRSSIELISWIQAYYPAPLGSIVELFTPPNMLKTRNIEQKNADILPSFAEHKHELNKEQSAAIQLAKSNPSKPILIHGNTGTGKTRIYIELIKYALKRSKSVIILTPEIGLTAPLSRELIDTFGDIVYVSHSSLTTSRRREIWLKVARSQSPIMLLGPRSALFYPLNNTGLIIIDEAHDQSYKQDQSPYYQTTRVAAQLCNLTNSQLVIGSATPLVTDYYTFSQKSLPIASLTNPATKSSTTTQTIIVDSKQRESFTKSSSISDVLLQSIAQALSNDEQVMLFLNKRGSARAILCSKCGWRSKCLNCDSYMTLHQDTCSLRCHTCNSKQTVPTACPECSFYNIVFKSAGTKALEQEILKLFPGSKVARFDRDTHDSQSISNQFESLSRGDIDIIIGTQSIVKGFDLPKLSVVGVLQADLSLNMPDYTAEEITYQLLSQVSGRVGRGHRDSKLIIQTFNPDGSVIKYALNKDYKSFYSDQLKERSAFNFPPYVFIMTITCTRSSGASAEKACLSIKEKIINNHRNILIDGPAPRFMEKRDNKYSWHLVVKAKSRKVLSEIARTLPANCTANLDPSNLL